VQQTITKVIVCVIDNYKIMWIAYLNTGRVFEGQLICALKRVSLRIFFSSHSSVFKHGTCNTMSLIREGWENS
jgi:hypothetical protein